MAFEIIRKDQQKSSAWAGGTTTQLAIYPHDASYRHRNFLFRLSTATIEKDESEFTSLPGINRYIMILNGRLELHHEGHHTKVLTPFETDTFDGGWKTMGRGLATDFNLMTRGETQGSLECLHLDAGEVRDLDFPVAGNFSAYYFLKGEARVLVTPDDLRANAGEGDLLLLSEGNKKQTLQLTALHKAKIVAANIRTIRLTYHHVGIPTLETKPDEEYLPEHKIFHSGFETSKYGIEWMRYEEGCSMPEIVKNIPHVAFEVDDIYEAVKGKKVLIQPNSPSDGVIVALIEENGAPVEFLQYVKKIEN